MTSLRAKEPENWASSPHRWLSASRTIHPTGDATCMNYLGIDVHKRESQVAVIDDDGAVAHEQRLENTALGELAEQYVGSKAAIEATGNYFTIYDTLDEHLDVTLVNPSKTRLIAEAKVKTDRVDAKRLAQLLRADMLAESYVPPDEIRERRTLVRGRKQLVEERTDLKNRVHSLLDQQGVTFDGDLFGVGGRDFLDDLSVDVVGRALLDAYLGAIDELTAQIRTLDQVIVERAGELEETQLLMSIPGVSYYSSLLITAEIGEIERFDSHKQLVSYAGLDPMVHQSGETEVRGGITKEGSAPLRWILVQCVNVAIRCKDEYLYSFYTRLKQRKSHGVALVAPPANSWFRSTTC